MRTTFIILALVLAALLMANCVFANNILVRNIYLTGQNTTKQTTMVRFDITWENSWRDLVNYDAAWVFVKYSTDNGATWRHAKLDTTGHVAPTGCTIDAGHDSNGVFIYRTANGNGTVTYNNVQLLWNYGVNGVADDAPVKVKVFAIEMVYVPTSEFAAGDGATGQNQFTLTTINTANATTAPSGTGSLGGQAGGYPTGQQALSSASWPNGYNAFYCMKYEITQEQYADFLNTLTSTQATNRYYLPPPAYSYRYSIAGTHPNFTSSKPYVACSFLSWMDGSAYADWAALRPMTELEFEKACRGDQRPVPHEYAWGTILATPATGVSNDGLVNESAANAGANCVANRNTGAAQGPMRVGCFATSSTTREQSGASYYGIMEMSGNLLEDCVAMTSQNFGGKLGDGLLSANGNGTNSDWPGWSSGEIVGWSHTKFRGGGWTPDNLEVSARLQYASGGRGYSVGFRCVRQAQ